jgi:nuclear pore complex protein Nup155
VANFPSSFARFSSSSPLLLSSPSPLRFVPFRDLNEVITCVALVEPKEGVFKEHIRYVLVITTPMEIVLVGVSFEGGDPRGDIVLHDTTFRASADDACICKIVGSPTGRIFMAARDGFVYELEYSNEEGNMFGYGKGTKCRKINKTESLVYQLLPAFLHALTFRVDSLRDIVVDESRNVLYTLSERSVITVVDLGGREEGVSEVFRPHVEERELTKLCQVRLAYIIFTFSVLAPS